MSMAGDKARHSRAAKELPMVDPSMRILILNDDQAVVYHLSGNGSGDYSFEFDEPEEEEWCAEGSLFPSPADTPFDLVVEGETLAPLMRLGILGRVNEIDYDTLLLFLSKYATHPVHDKIRKLYAVAAAQGSIPMEMIESVVRQAFGEVPVRVPSGTLCSTDSV
jgi:hypothetical protein